MLQPDPEMRHDLGDCVISKWMQGPTATAEEVMQEINRRKEVSEQKAKKKSSKSSSSKSSTRRDVELNGKRYV